MKSLTVFSTALAMALTMGGTSAFAQHGGGGGHGGGMGGGSGMGGGAGMGRGSGNMGPDMGKMGSMDRSMNAPSMNAKNPERILSHNANLSSRLQPLLPAGTDLANAASGFKNLGQFVSAIHVAHNLNIPLSDLKARMTSGENLGKAIHEMKPDVNAKDAVKTANRQAKETLRKAGP